MERRRRGALLKLLSELDADGWSDKRSDSAPWGLLGWLELALPLLVKPPLLDSLFGLLFLTSGTKKTKCPELTAGSWVVRFWIEGLFLATVRD